MVRVRNLREGEVDSLPPALLDTGMFYLVPEWVWVVEAGDTSAPFALIVTSFAHGLLVLWRILAISPLPAAAPLNWFLEALPQVFSVARLRGCVGFFTLLADNKPAEVKMARIVSRMARGGILPFQGSIAAGQLA
jgi:hypothetical protein